jgi:hypothetical protein
MLKIVERILKKNNFHGYIKIFNEKKIPLNLNNEENVLYLLELEKA